MQKKQPPHKFSIIGGRLEAIIAESNLPSKEPLLWQNAFFGRKSRKTATLPSRMEAGNSPSILKPNHFGRNSKIRTFVKSC